MRGLASYPTIVQRSWNDNVTCQVRRCVSSFTSPLSPAHLPVFFAFCIFFCPTHHTHFSNPLTAWQTWTWKSDLTLWPILTAPSGKLSWIPLERKLHKWLSISMLLGMTTTTLMLKLGTSNKRLSNTKPSAFSRSREILRSKSGTNMLRKNLRENAGRPRRRSQKSMTLTRINTTHCHHSLPFTICNAKYSYFWFPKTVVLLEFWCISQLSKMPELVLLLVLAI